MRAWLVLLAASLFALPPPAGAAQTAVRPAASPDAAAAFRQARVLYRAGDHKAALRLFRSAYRQSSSPNARLYIGRCLRELGELAAAYEEMAATVRQATKAAEKSSKYAPTRDSAAAELAMLERLVGKAIVAVANPPAGTRVKIGETEVDESRLGMPVAVLPGAIRVTVSAPGKRRVTRLIEVAAQQTLSLTIVLQDVDSQPALPLASAGQSSTGPLHAKTRSDGQGGASPGPQTSAGNGLGAVRIAGIVMGAAGLVGIGIFAVTAVAAKSRFNDVDSACGGGPCDPAFDQNIEDGRTLQTVANTALIVGSALTLGGVGMVVFGGPTEPDSASIGFTVHGMSGGGVELVGRF